MTEIHRFLAIATGGVAVAGLVWSIALAVLRRPAGRSYAMPVVAALACALVTGMLGGLLLGTGKTPADALHIVYGLVSIVAVPIAFVMAAGRSPRAQAVAMSLGWLVEIGVIVRLFQTG